MDCAAHLDGARKLDDPLMAFMLGSSRIIPWKLCRCRQCRHDGRSGHGKHTMTWMVKRSARNREDRLWRREAAQ